MYFVHKDANPYNLSHNHIVYLQDSIDWPNRLQHLGETLLPVPPSSRYLIIGSSGNDPPPYLTQPTHGLYIEFMLSCP